MTYIYFKNTITNTIFSNEFFRNTVKNLTLNHFKSLFIEMKKRDSIWRIQQIVYSEPLHVLKIKHIIIMWDVITIDGINNYAVNFVSIPWNKDKILLQNIKIELWSTIPFLKSFKFKVFIQLNSICLSGTGFWKLSFLQH
jgi:hypothetical protein